MSSDQIPFPGLKIVEDPSVPPGETQLRRAPTREECEAAVREMDGVLLSYQGPDAHDAPTERMPAADAGPFPEDAAEVPASQKPTEQTVKVIRCTKCKASIETTLVTSDHAQLCATCFALLLNGVGTLADGPNEAEKPTRISFQLTAPPKDIQEHQRHLPDAIENAIGQAAKEFGAELRAAFFAGEANVFKLLAQAKVHGLTLLVVIQPAIRQPKPAPAPVPDLRRKGKA